MKYKLGDIKGSFFFLKKIKNMSYVLALCNGFAQSSNPPTSWVPQRRF